METVGYYLAKVTAPYWRRWRFSLPATAAVLIALVLLFPEEVKVVAAWALAGVLLLLFLSAFQLRVLRIGGFYFTPRRRRRRSRPAGTDGLSSELSRLAELRRDGQLTEAEFEQAKREILRGSP
ncbi:MAG: SHOCT domain-containing protein [Chloroflexi bacterium]|nr:SHOCT domain-containing protein [Chloroflexota bacterium]